MSIPYFVHREDADAYDCYNRAMEPFREEQKKLEAVVWNKIIQNNLSSIELNEETYKLDIIFLEKTNHIKEPKIRLFTAFDPKPKDIENYYTYYRGMRWGDAANCDMMGIAKSVIKKCKQALRRSSGKSNNE